MNWGMRIRNSPAQRLLLAGAVALAVVAVTASVPRAQRGWRAARSAVADEAACRELAAALAPLEQAMRSDPAAAPRRVLDVGGRRGAVPELLDRLAALGAACDVKVLGMTPEVSSARQLAAAAGERGAPGDGDPVAAGDAAGVAAGAAGRVPAYSILWVRIEAEADFADLGRYFEELAGLDVPLAVTALRLEPAGRGGANAVAASFTLGTWVVARPAAGGAADEAA